MNLKCLVSTQSEGRILKLEIRSQKLEIRSQILEVKY